MKLSPITVQIQGFFYDKQFLTGLSEIKRNFYKCSMFCVSPFAQIEIETADPDCGLVLVSFQTNKNIFLVPVSLYTN